jgi:lichenan operon transcriptional antiterminator
MTKEISIRQDRIISYLKKSNKPVTGKELSEILGVSDRTVRNDIEVIKQSIPNLIGASRREGYFIQNNLRTEHTVTVEYTPNERLIFMMKELVVSNGKIEIYELADTLFVSHITIWSDYNELKKIVNTTVDSISITRSNDYIELDGTLEERCAFLHLLVKKLGNPLNIYQLSKFFVDVNLDEIVNEVVQVLLKNELFSRYLSLEQLVLYLLIINELSLNEILNDYSGNTPTENSVKEILDIISADYLNEYLYSYEPLVSNILVNIREMESIESEIRINGIESSEFYTFFNEVLHEVENMYKVDFLSNKKYCTDLIVHTRIALYRMEKNILIINPLMNQLKNEFPFLFDIGFYITKRIEEKWGTRLNNEEVSFIVSHLIHTYDDSKTDTDSTAKINLYLVTLDGSSIANYIIERINDLTINRYLSIIPISSLFELKQIETKINSNDLVISTLPLFLNGRKTDLVINPQITITDEFNMKFLINQEVNKIKKVNFENIFNRFFDERYVSYNCTYETKEDAIKKLSNQFIDLGYMDDVYQQSILEREELLTTSLPTGIALPHATKLNAKKSAIAICFPNKEMHWGEYQVRIVLLFIVATDDTQYLNELYNLIAEFAMSHENIREVSKSKSFDELKDKLFKFYMNKNGGLSNGTK